MRAFKRPLSISIVTLLWLLFYSAITTAMPSEVEGQWYQAATADWHYQERGALPMQGLQAVEAISLTGGEYWFQGRFVVEQAGDYVLDFKNSTTIGRFEHHLFAQDGRALTRLAGGIEHTDSSNPYFLRHGRELTLAAGEYLLVTRMDSPFYLAQPSPYIRDRESYRQSIKGGNALVLAGLGVFLGLGLYYAILSLYRRRRAEAMYALFILGNLIYNSTALLVLPDLFHLHWFYGISLPILFSNMAYILFVMALLHIHRDVYSRLYTAGLVSLALLVVMASVAFMLPNWSLEMARAGVGLFLLYGLSAGIAGMRRGSKTAKRYLVAVGLFVLVGGSAISQSELPSYSYVVEHLGLFAVMLEVILLSIVISYQFRQLQDDRETIYTDLTEEKHRRQELASAIAEAERANRAKTEFLSNMSHELRTPMNSILGFSEIMLEEEELPSKSMDDVRRIHRAGAHLLRLINDVLDLSKIEAGKLELSIETVDLNEIIDESFCLLHPLSTAREIGLSDDKYQHRYVLADRIRVKQVLINLLSNGIKYNHNGGEVRIETEERDGYLRITVIDNGKGIAAGQIEAIFEPFNRLAEENSTIEGSGIGLTLSRSMIEQMHGQIGVDSCEGEGSRFWFELPISSNPVEGGPVASNRTQAVPRRAGQHTLLYVDDNPMNLVFVERILENQPHLHLITAHEAQLGLELAASHRPAIILLDINMPHLNGYQVLERLRRMPELQDTPVFAVTADAVGSEIQAGLDAGFSEFLIKPVEVARFLKLVERYLARPGPEDTP